MPIAVLIHSIPVSFILGFQQVTIHFENDIIQRHQAGMEDQAAMTPVYKESGDAAGCTWAQTWLLIVKSSPSTRGFPKIGGH